MKKYALALFLVMATSGCLAAGPVSVSSDPGAIQMPDARCQMSVSNSNVDYGLQSRWQMQDVDGTSQAVTPGKRQLSVTVICPYTHAMRLTVLGDRTPRGEFRYGDTGKLLVRVISAQLDGQTVSVALSTPEGLLRSAPQDTLVVLPNQPFSAVTGNQPAHGKALNVRLEIQPMVTDNDARVSSRQVSESTLSVQFAD